tara:strand:- start:1527 stop:3533 length:2007 start_codon:yes stop_codon:yes gene_type:complete
MAKYQRQGTNKYYGAGNAGYVSSGSSVDGLAKSLTNAGYQIGKAEELRIDRKKDKAIAKIDELYANGKSFETIQAEIIKGDHPELTGKYVDATTNYHAGKVKAHEVITNIKANKDKYDITDESNSLELFYKQYMPDTKSMDASTLLGFTTHFNKFKSVDALNDAENRAAYNSEKKVMEGVGILSDEPIETLKKNLPSILKDMQVPLPMRDGTGSTLLYTNAETLAVVRRSIVDIIANAKTEADLAKADILMNTNLGYSKSGSAIGTLASRKSKEVLAIQDELTKKRRQLEINDREEADYQRKQEVKKIYAELYSDVTETDEQGNVTTRPRTHTEKMALRDRLEAMGDVQAVANFDKAMIADLYINDDPQILDDFIVKIYSDGFGDIEEMKEEFNKLDTDPRKMGAMLDHYENSQKDDNAKLHINNLTYSSGSTAIMNIVEGSFKNQKRVDARVQAQAESSVKRHVMREIYDFESDYFKQNGKTPSNKEREAFMVELENYISKQYVNAPATTKSIAQLETRDDLTEKEITKDFDETDRFIEEEAQKERDATVISTNADGEEITLGSYVDTVLSNFDTVDPPKLRKTVIAGIISEDEKYRQQTLPKIQKYITSIVGETMTKEVFDMMSTADYQEIVKQVASNLKMTTGNKTEDQKIYQQLDNIFQTLIGE